MYGFWNVPFFFLLIGESWGSSMMVDTDQRDQLMTGHPVPKNQKQWSTTALQVHQAIVIPEQEIWNGENGILKSMEWFSPVDNKITGRRLPFMMPVMYNLGVITTLLVVLTVLMFKGLTLGIIILILHLQGKRKNHAIEHPTRPVHIHVHGDSKIPSASKHYFYPDQWDRQDEEPYQYNSTAPDYLYHPRGFKR